MMTQKWLLFFIQPPADALFEHPRLFRACVPPGMHRFRGNIWDYDTRPHVMKTLGYPLEMTDRIPEITEARNVELGLGLQVALLSPLTLLFPLVYQDIKNTDLAWFVRVGQFNTLNVSLNKWTNKSLCFYLSLLRLHIRWHQICLVIGRVCLFVWVAELFSLQWYFQGFF